MRNIERTVECVLQHPSFMVDMNMDMSNPKDFVEKEFINVNDVPFVSEIDAMEPTIEAEPWYRKLSGYERALVAEPVAEPCMALGKQYETINKTYSLKVDPGYHFKEHDNGDEYSFTTDEWTQHTVDLLDIALINPTYNLY